MAASRSTVAGVTIKTNNRVRETFYIVHDDDKGWVRADLETLDLDDYYDQGFEFRGSIYALSEFEPASHDLKARGWDGHQGESYFSAVLVTYFDLDGYELDGVIVGYAHW